MRTDTAKLVRAGVIGDLFDLRSDVSLRWAKRGDTPSIKLPNGRFMFDPDEGLASLKSRGSVNHVVPAITSDVAGQAGIHQSYEQHA